MEKKHDLCIIHEEDGEHIAEFMMERLTCESLGFKVRTCSLPIQWDYKDLSASLALIFLTPDMVDAFKIKGYFYFTKILKNFGTSAFLCYDHGVDTEDSTVQRSLGSLYIELETIHIEKGRSSWCYRKAMLRITQLIEKPYDAPVLISFKLYPKEIWNASDNVLIVFKRAEEQHDISVTLKDNMSGEEGKEYKCIKVNQCVYSFSPKGATPGMKTVEVFSNNRSAGISKLKIRNKMEILSILTNKVSNDVLYNSLNCHSHDTFDRELTDILTNGGFPSPLQALEYKEDKSSNSKYHNEYPTLLHFGAKFGLEKFCHYLLQLPEYSEALQCRNEDGKTPSEIASDFPVLAAKLSSTHIERTDIKDTDIQMRSDPQNRNSRGASFRMSEFTDRMTFIWNDNMDVPVEITKL